MADKPEELARAEIDRLLTAAGWLVQPAKQANIQAARGVALCNFPLKDAHGFADYMLYVDGKAAGVLEAKKQGFTLSGVEIQSDKYVRGLPDTLPDGTPRTRSDSDRTVSVRVPYEDQT